MNLYISRQLILRQLSLACSTLCPFSPLPIQLSAY